MTALQRAAFEAERTKPMRLRVVVVVVVSLLIWAHQAVLYEDQLFPVLLHGRVYRLFELLFGVGMLAWVSRPRGLASTEWGVAAGLIGWTVAHAAAISVMFDDSVVPATMSMEWGQVVIVLASMMSFRPSLAVLAVTWTLGALVTSYRAQWDLDLSDHLVLLVIYGVVLAHVRSVFRLAVREFTARAHLDGANEALRQAEEARSRLFVNLSHDFRTPLALIHAEAEQIAQEGSAERRADGLARVQVNAMALADLTNQLLELARLDAGQAPREPVDLDLVELGRQVVAQFSGTRGGVEVRCAVDHEGPLGVRGDPGQVRRILTNLVDNATRQRGGLVELVLRPDGDDVVADVIDEGPGVPPERRGAIFERFASFDAAGSVASGLGLPVARELAELNGGSLVLADDRPKTTFRLRLPRARGPLQRIEAAAPAPRAAPTRAPEPSQQGRTVLIVEDHPDMAALLAQLLAPRFSVRAASTVSEALDALAGPVPAAVVSDIMLPDGDGYAVLAHVRGRRELEGVPVLFVSALAEPEQRARGLAAGAHDYVTKPFSGEELIARVEAATAHAERRRQALERQRTEMMAELHDGAAAAMARALLLLDIAAAGHPEMVGQARDAVREALTEARELLPLLDAGARPWTHAVAELEAEIGAVARPFSMDVALEVDADDSVPWLTPAEAYALRRLAREAATNVLRHAHASRIVAHLGAHDGRVELIVDDDGVGLPGGSGGRGMAIARRRTERIGGTVRWEPAPIGGTRMAVDFHAAAT